MRIKRTEVMKRWEHANVSLVEERNDLSEGLGTVMLGKH